ncbi:unnamed protein product [Gordionus sp. m RMFG-2023]
MSSNSKTLTLTKQGKNSNSNTMSSTKSFKEVASSSNSNLTTSSNIGNSSHQKHQKLTKEEEILLQDFSRNVSTKSSALFYGNGMIITAIPAWIFWRIYPVEPTMPLLMMLFVILTLPATFLMAYAYKNVKFVLKHKFAQKREEAVTREVTSSLTFGSSAAKDNSSVAVTNNLDDVSPNNMGLANAINTKKMISRKDRDERILWKKNEVSDYEATTYSIFYNNSLFLLCFLVCSCLLLASTHPPINYALSMIIASGLTALFSTGTS